MVQQRSARENTRGTDSYLFSSNQRDVAKLLGGLYANQLSHAGTFVDVGDGQQDNTLGSAQRSWLSQKISSLGEIVWGERYKPEKDDNYEKSVKKRQDGQKIIKAMMDDAPDDTCRHALLAAYVRMGHLYEIAGHVARENFFQARQRELEKFVADRPGDTPPDDLLAPGGIHQLLFSNERVQDVAKKNGVAGVVDMLSKPVSEYVFTQHPTNTNTLEFMRTQRALAGALDKVVNTRGSDAEHEQAWTQLHEQMQRFAQTPVVSTQNFTAKDETDIVVNFLANAYQDIDRLYEVTDRGLGKRFGAEYSLEQRMALDLRLNFGSWGSAGDKDGNNNIKSENTLEAIVLHKQKALELIGQSLTDISRAEEVPGLREWQERLKKAYDGYSEIVRELEMSRHGNDIALTNDKFKEMSQKIQAMNIMLGPVDKLKDFIGEALQKGDQHDAAKDGLLSLHRKLRVFGYNLGKIEYRETAEEYSRAVNRLMDTDKARELISADSMKLFTMALERKDDELRSEALTKILSEQPDAWVAISRDFMQNHRGERLRDYKDKEGDAIVYHTLRRMELARDFGDMITHNVLAECKGTHNLLEALAMQVATTRDDGTRAMLNIVPLFEEADTMEKIPEVLQDGMDNPVYRAHMEALAAKDPSLTQQIQIAHSDNARRAGAIASRGIIHEGHDRARAAEAAYNKKILQWNAAHADQPPKKLLRLQFFEGGSLSDSYRNGVRAATATMRDFDLGEFSKMTFQGGDLLNYFNQPTSFERLTLRGLVQQVELMNPSNGHKEEAPVMVMSEEQIKRLEDKSHAIRTLEDQDNAVIRGLKLLQRSYDELIYEKAGNPIGKLLYAVGYRDHVAAGNAGTRAGGRSNDPQEEEKREIDASKIRTIGFSETLQHEGIHPTFLGAGTIRDSIEQELHAKPTAEQWHRLYEQSPTFRDAIDKLAYSIANSDLKHFGSQYNLKQAQKKQKEIGAIDKELDDLDSRHKAGKIDVMEFVAKTTQLKEKRHKTLDYYQGLIEFANITLPNQYMDAGKLVYEAMSGKEFIDNERKAEGWIEKTMQLINRFRTILTGQGETIDLDPATGQLGTDGKGNILDAADRMRSLVRSMDSMQQYDALYTKHSYVEGLRTIEESFAGMISSAKEGLRNLFSRLLHNARDTLYHGRTFVADDPKYGQALVAQMEKAREAAKNGASYAQMA